MGAERVADRASPALDARATDEPRAGLAPRKERAAATTRSGRRERTAARSWRTRLFLVVGGWVIAAAMKVIGVTTRKRYLGYEPLGRRFASGEPVILTFWHGRMVMMPFAYEGRGACIMNSRHRDGELISRAIRRFGIEVVHGSSTRGWVGGLKGLLAAFARGRDLVVVPDGPRGPRCRAKSGVIQLARATGAPIYPASYGASRSWVLRRSWDWLAIPRPFARVTYVVAEPLVVPREATATEVEELALELERRLNEATRRADAAVGLAGAGTEEYVGGVATRRKS